MTNEELTVLVLDKFGWLYDKELNPKRYRHTKPLLAGDLILSILDNETVTKAAVSLGFSYKVVNTSIAREFVPILGNINGGFATWRFRLEDFISYQKCTKCKELKSYDEYHLDSNNPRGYNYICKSCRVLDNAEYYKKESTKEIHAHSYGLHYHDILARNAQYRVERAKRAVVWADQEKIKEFYKNCPNGMHVDHKIPLKGELVSGLHVHDNLQYLTPEENMKKGNRFEI